MNLNKNYALQCDRVVTTGTKSTAVWTAVRNVHPWQLLPMVWSVKTLLSK